MTSKKEGKSREPQPPMPPMATPGVGRYFLKQTVTLQKASPKENLTIAIGIRGRCRQQEWKAHWISPAWWVGHKLELPCLETEEAPFCGWTTASAEERKHCEMEIRRQ